MTGVKKWRSRGSSGADQRTDLFTGDDTADVAGAIQIENDDGKVVVLAKADGGGVHHLEALLQHFHVADLVEHFGILDDDRIGVVDAVNLRSLENDVGL